MAADKQRILRKYKAIQERYKELRKKFKHNQCLQKLDEEFFLAPITLEYIIFEEYDNKPKKQIVRNQLNFQYAPQIQ